MRVGEMDERAGSKWDRAARYLKIAMILKAHPQGIRAAEIAERVGVSKRTVYRDLAGMERDAGLPIWEDEGRWGLDSGAFLPPLDLTLHEAMMLYLAARVLSKASDEYDSELIGAFVKLAEILPPVMREHIQATVGVFAATPRNPTFTRVLRVLTEGWAFRRVVAIEYDSGAYDPTREPRRARVRPYAIEPSALTHALYLIGHDEERGARRTFKVERIRAASLTPETFAPEPTAVPAADLVRAWDVIADEPLEHVAVRFSAGVARRVAETRWHPSQRLESQPDGSLVWHAQIAGLHEVRIWILGWGADVEVLLPASLREEIAGELRCAAEQYPS